MVQDLPSVANMTAMSQNRVLSVLLDNRDGQTQSKRRIPPFLKDYSSQEEIGEVFEHLAGGGGVKAVDKRPPPVPPRNGGHHQQKLNSQNQRATRARHPNRAGQPVTAWPDGILAEFNNLIAEFTTNAHPDPVPEICGGSEGKKEEEQMRYKLAQRDVPEGGAGQPVLLRAGPLPQAPPPPPTDLQPAQHHQLSHVTLTDMEESEDSGLERSAEILDSPLADNPPSSRDVDCGTQTSPTMSRSSSFTWMSDCSSVPGHSPPDSIEGEDDTTSTSSGDDPPSHRKDDPESGIGTSSPPNNRTSKGGMGGGQKCRRKETWERLRRRQSGGGGKQFVGWGDDEVWVRQGGEGGEWSSDPEVGGGAGAVAVAGAAGRRPRPTCLPLQPPPPLPHPLPPASASPLASPTSLKHAAPPLPPELTNKSSSAPLLANSAHPLTRSASASSARVMLSGAVGVVIRVTTVTYAGEGLISILERNRDMNHKPESTAEYGN
ncbi:hypothetical protein AAG570_010881 [Ranatra chinensis]|uniref:Uncharacterized protein n=1 Tax=Ranatra chinensis TaxID=642074 RepID=A0ABD0Z183_9HEMI